MLKAGGMPVATIRGASRGWKMVLGCRRHSLHGKRREDDMGTTVEKRGIQVSHFHTSHSALKKKRNNAEEESDQASLFDDAVANEASQEGLFDEIGSTAPTAGTSAGSFDKDLAFDTMHAHLLKATLKEHPYHLKPKRALINRFISLAHSPEQVRKLLPILERWHLKQYGYRGLTPRDFRKNTPEFVKGHTWRLLQARAIQTGALDCAWNVLADVGKYGIRPGSASDVVPFSNALLKRLRMQETQTVSESPAENVSLDPTQTLLLLPAVLKAMEIDFVNDKLSENIAKALDKAPSSLRESDLARQVSAGLQGRSGLGQPAQPSRQQARAFSTLRIVRMPVLGSGPLGGVNLPSETSKSHPSATLEGSTTLAPTIDTEATQSATRPQSDGFYKVTQTRSPIGLQEEIRANLFSLGLRRRLQTVYRPHNAVEAGKILKVKELVRVENVTSAQAAEGIASGQGPARKARRETEKGWKVIGSCRIVPNSAVSGAFPFQQKRSFSSLLGMRSRSGLHHGASQTRSPVVRAPAVEPFTLAKRHAGIFAKLVQGLLSRENKAKQEVIRPQSASSVFDEAEGRPSDLDTANIPMGQRYSPYPAMSHHYRTGNFKTSPKKLNLLARQISGKHIQDAIEQMQFSAKRKRAHRVRNMLCTARDHAVGYKRMDPARLYVAQAWVGKGLYLKRLEIKGRARTGIRVHPSAHLAVELRLRPTVAETLAKEKRLLAKKKARMTIIEDKPIYNPKSYYNW